MLKHLSQEELLDVVEDVGGEFLQGHVAACESCGQSVERAREGLMLAREVEVPEPAAPYWEVFRRAVSRRIAADSPRAWWRLRPAPALAAAAALLAVMTFYPSQPPRGPEPLPAWSALPPSEEDPGLQVLRALAPAPEEVPLLGDCRGATECLAGLSEDESQAFAEALRHEIGQQPL